MLKYQTKKIVNVSAWDNLVRETYGRPYSFQQQDGCQERGMHTITIPDINDDEEEMYESIPEVVNGNEMGVKFDVWLKRDPKQPLAGGRGTDWEIDLFWTRNFYPNIQTVANDMYEKGLIEKGTYLINIDW